MATLDSTIGTTTANSYISVADADVYFGNSLYATAWANLTDSDTDTDTKCKALISATRLLDSKYEFDGTKTDNDQALSFPRYGIVNRDGYSYDSDMLPKSLQNATAELALTLLTNATGTYADPETAGIARVKAGTIDVVFDKEDRSNSVPDNIENIIRHLILEGGAEPAFRQSRVVR